MNRMLVAAMSGLLCVGAVRDGVAEPGATAPAGSTNSPRGGNIGTAAGGAAGMPNAGATPLSYQEYFSKLQEFYAKGKVLYANSRSDKLTDKDVDSRFKEFMDWANGAGNWMSDNIGPAATAKFTTWHAEFGKPHKLAGNHPEEENNKFQTLRVVLPQLLDNLRFLMTPGAMSALEANAASSK
jgi:hypothetical protein